MIALHVVTVGAILLVTAKACSLRLKLRPFVTMLVMLAALELIV